MWNRAEFSARLHGTLSEWTKKVLITVPVMCMVPYTVKIILHTMKTKQSTSLFRASNGTSYLVPFLFICSLFLLWGFAHGLLDVLDKHFQDILHVSKAQSGFVQFSLYFAYLIMAV